MASEDKGNKNPGVQKLNLREIVGPKKGEQPLVEKGSRGVTVDNIDRNSPPIQMQPKPEDNKPSTPANAPDAANANPGSTKDEKD